MMRPIKLFVQTLLLALLTLPGVVTAAQKADPARPPLYSCYDFGGGPRVINFAIQPLGVPIGVIGEVMRRDRLLREDLARLGYEVRFHPFLKGDDITPFFRQGKISVAMGGDMPTIMAAASLDIVVPALAKQGFSTVVARDAITVADLKGKRIGYPPNSNAHYALLTALSTADLKESDVRLVPMEVSEMVDALDRGRIDAFAAWEPVPSIALKHSTRSRAVFRHLNSSYLYFSRALADRHPEAASALLASMVRAFAWLRKDEGNLLQASSWALEAGGRLQGRPVRLSAEEIAEMTMRDILSITSHPTIPEIDLTDRGTVRRKFDFLMARGLVPAATQAAKVLQSFDREMVSRVLRRPKKYRLERFAYEPGRME